MPPQETVRGFAAIVDGEADDLPEWAFFDVGTLEDARQKAAEKLAEEKGGARLTNKFMLNITASSGEYYQGDCEDLVLPISDGVYGIQAGHSPVLVAIHMGILHFEVNGESRDILVGDGIAEVTPAYVMVLVDSAERPEDIDKNRAEAARIRAEERLQHQQSMHEYYQSKIALDRAMQRLQAAAKYRR